MRPARVLLSPIALLVLDHDGTISRLREGWVEDARAVMLARAPDERAAAAVLRDGGGEPAGRLFARHARACGLDADDPAPLADYERRLARRMRGRLARPSSWLVPGMRELMTAARAAGLGMVVLSGSPAALVERELAAFGLRGLPDAVLGPLAPDDPDFGKAGALAKLLADRGLAGGRVAGLGDGVAETAAVRELGGVAIGMSPPGDPERLRAAGAVAFVRDGRALAIGEGPSLLLREPVL